ncbi:acyltransferase, partial [Ralstonia solanacearum]
VEQGDPATLADARLRAILAFARTLIERPIDGDRDALLRLPAAGLATPDVVTLSQLIAFLSYQTRLVAGLRALREASQAHPAHPTGQPAASTETAA